jgi:hypothetical protein
MSQITGTANVSHAFLDQRVAVKEQRDLPR